MKPSVDVPAQYTDVTAEITRKNGKLLFHCTLWCAVVIALEYFYLWQYFCERINLLGSILIAVFLVLIYPIRKGILIYFTDRGWGGVVRDVKKHSYLHFKRPGAGYRYTSMTTRFEGHLYLHGKEGRAPFLEKRFPVRKKFILRSGDAELPYQIGDTVRCYRGTAYPIIVHSPHTDGYPPRICVFCGKTETDRERTVCDFCGFSLITAEETVREVEYGM